MRSMNYPAAPKKKVVETKFGYKIVDEYRLFEKPENPKVKKWVDAQNKLVNEEISTSLRRKFTAELKKQFNLRVTGTPVRLGSKYFWQERQPKEDQFVLYYKEGLSGAKHKLIDPNKLSTKDKIVSLDYWYPSTNGKYLAFGMSEGGDEISAMQVMEVATGKIIETVSKNASYASCAWLPDESGFYFEGGPKEGTVPEGEERLHYRVYFHKVGQKERNDVIFGEGRDKEEMMSLSISSEGRWLFITSTANWTNNDLFAYDIKNDKLVPLITGLDAQFWPHATAKKVFVSTDYKAPNSRIISADLDKLPRDISGWKEVIPETKDQITYSDYTKDKIIVVYLVNASSQIKIFDYAGKKLEDITLPAIGSVNHVSASVKEDEFFYSYESFVIRNTIYRFNPDNQQYEVYDGTKGMLKPEDYEVKQEWFKSKDGTKVPMFIVHKRTLRKDGSNPTLLYGYGGFASSVTPAYLSSLSPWIERGGIYAMANIRGGDEFGKNWHLDGIKKNKQHSYDDFAAAAEHLIDQKYTSSEKLAIRGGSNGGLLVLAVSVQRPELFRAVISEVPLADMVRFPYFLIASRWKSEYGDPEKKADLENILKFSPYHNVKSSTKYPTYFITTALNDTRVHPMHAWKMGALLQSLENQRDVFVWTDKSTGHMGSLTLSKFYEERSLNLAFLAKELQLKVS